jgi:hypothetical protein
LNLARRSQTFDGQAAQRLTHLVTEGQVGVQDCRPGKSIGADSSSWFRRPPTLPLP